MSVINIKKILSGVFTYQILVKVFNILINVLILRNLSISEIGIFLTLLALYSLFLDVSDFGLNRALLNSKRVDLELVNYAYSVRFFLAQVVSFLFIAIYFLSPEIFVNFEIFISFILLFFIFFLTFLPRYNLTKEIKVDTLSQAEALNSFVYFIMILSYVTFSELSIKGVVFSIVVSNIFYLLFMLWNSPSSIFNVNFRFGLRKKFLMNSFKIISFSFLFMLFFGLDKLLVSKFVSSYSLGIYAFLIYYSNYFHNLIFGTIGKFTFSTATHLHRESKNINQYEFDLSLITALVYSIFSVFFVVIPNNLITEIIGVQWYGQISKLKLLTVFLNVKILSSLFLNYNLCKNKSEDSILIICKSLFAYILFFTLGIFFNSFSIEYFLLIYLFYETSIFLLSSKQQQSFSFSDFYILSLPFLFSASVALIVIFNLNIYYEIAIYLLSFLIITLTLLQLQAIKKSYDRIVSFDY